MKKIIGIILFFLTMDLTPGFSAHAESPFVASEDRLLTSPDYEEISLLRNEIEVSVPADILYEEGIKIYTDADILALGTDNADVILDALDDADYVWKIPFENHRYPKEYWEGCDYGNIALSRGIRPEEEIKYVLKENGEKELIREEREWKDYNLESKGTCYYEKIVERATNIPGCTRVVVLQEQWGMQMEIALALSDTKALAWILFEDTYYPMVEDERYSLSPFFGENIYDYKEFAEAALAYSKEYQDSGSGLDDSSFYGNITTAEGMPGSIFAEEDWLLSEVNAEEFEQIKAVVEKEYANSNVDYSKAVKVYLNPDIFSLNTEDRNTILSEVVKSDYIWVIPFEVFQKGKIVVAKRPKLDEEVKSLFTEEEQEELLEKVGEWGISEVKTDGRDYYYDRIVEKASSLSGCSRIVILSGMPGFDMPMALAFDEIGAIAWISLGFDYSVIGENTSLAVEQGIYDFWEISDNAKSMSQEENTTEELEKEKSPDYRSLILIAGGVIVLGVGLGFIMDFRNRKK